MHITAKKTKIPTYIHDVFKNGIPADFRLIGATTRKPEEIPRLFVQDVSKFILTL